MWARSYAVRALVAVGFLVGFYLLALGIAGALVGIVVASIAAHHIIPKLDILCLLGAGTILWSLVPRQAPWKDPGPRITAQDHPRLFALIGNIAQAMHMRMPAEVYLMPEVNAFVVARGGFLGLGGRRVMAIGMPLLATENVSQLSATIAHEFGHFAGGDTRLGGVIYATRRAMIETVQNVGKSSVSVLRAPFEWMLRTYLGITQSISRQQELVADSWSVKVAGKEAHMSGLELEAVHGAAFGIYMQEEVQPLSSQGCAPDNVFEGYRRYVGSRRFNSIRPELETQLHKMAVDKYDSHPGLEDRLAFARGLEGGEQPMDRTSAWTLLNEPQRIEAQFSEELRPASLRPVPWDEVSASWARMWRARAARLQARLPEFTLQEWIRVATDPSAERAAQTQFVETVYPRYRGDRTPGRKNDLRAAAHQLLASWLAAVLAESGFQWKTQPGEPVVVTRGEVAVDAAEIAAAVLEGRQPAEAVAALAPDVLDAGTRLHLADEERARALEESQITFGTRKQAVTATFPAGDVFLPGCCPVCAGAATDAVQVRLRLNREHSSAEMVVTLFPCAQHAPQVLSAVRFVDLDSERQLVTLEFRHPEYAAVLRECVT